MCPPLVPINENLKYTPGMWQNKPRAKTDLKILDEGIAGVNNFGVGGVNATVLLAPNRKSADPDSLKIADEIPRLINICARTEVSLKKMFEFIEKNPDKITRDFLALIADTMKTKPTLNSSGLPYRGQSIGRKIRHYLNELLKHRLNSRHYISL